MEFKKLGVMPSIQKSLAKENYIKPTPIQQQAIPAVLQGKDVLACAQTGTGKTAAFAVPTLQLLSQSTIHKKKAIRSLILTPTRELAMQIFESFTTYGSNLNLKACVIFGGVSQVPQVKKLEKGVDILIATPGRLMDLVKQRIIDLSSIEIFTLDEADRMLDMGFIHDVKRIITNLPKKKQTLLFSATMPPEIIKIVDELLHEPVKITVTPISSAVEVIDQSVYFVDKKNKIKLLLNILMDANIKSVLVFTRTKRGADRVAKELSKHDIQAQAIHGNKSQNARQNALNNFKCGTTRILVATDIAARGIDIDELSYVINYDLPEVAETYVHRIGRTGRAGMSGVAIAFCDFEEKPLFGAIEKLIKKRIPEVKNHPFPMLITTIEPKKEPQRKKAQERSTKKKIGHQNEKTQTKKVPIKKGNTKNQNMKSQAARRGNRNR